MTDNHQYNHFVIFALILIVGLGLALALPWLANAQSLAADETPNEPPDYAEVVHSAELAYVLAAEGNGNLPIPPGPCFATHKDVNDEKSSLDASAVQQAVDAASSGDTVKVAGTCIGIVTRAGLTQTVYISKSLTLEGGHTPNDWTLEPDPDSNPTILHAFRLGRVIVISGTEGVTLDSLYLTGGVAEDFTLYNDGGGIWSNSEITLKNSIIYSNTAGWGGGMYNMGVSPVLSNVTFSNNSVWGRGGAMYNNGESGTSSPILTDVTFSGNKAQIGGAMYNDGEDYGTSSPTLTNVTFSDNKAITGGAMCNSGFEFGDSSPKLNNVAFYGNSAESAGGGMYNSAMFGNTSPELTNVTFSGNSADNGGAIYNAGTDSTNIPNLINVIFSGNSAKRNGGAIFNSAGISGISSPILTNVTFSGNKAMHGGAMYCEASDHGGICNPDVRNSILWNNQDSSGTGTITATIFLTNNATITLMHSLAQGTGDSNNWTLDSSFVNGGDNIDTDPLFILDINPSTAPTTAGNLRLQTGSPAIDVGDNTFMVGVLTDLDGEPRITDGDGDFVEIVDMGAYETPSYYKYVYLPLINR